MAIHLSAKELAAIAQCSCGLPHGMYHPRVSKKEIVIPPVLFSVLVLLAWAAWPPAVWWLLGIYGSLVILTFFYRIVRGHETACAVKWSPVAALYVIGDGIASATP